ncbi:hypothetical protein A9G34_07540 [Gilliamella sp. Choc4-2]|uniref:hypothetical protein n=1 Tax=unclassified Gilliamella TaxID=2685620 RepID=UPI00080E7D27|nr:hypothetical protein [Gilliamella apicola]OCG31823.1 hypothetical protein A9G33_04625 [Gilliamella apicola]OCG43835.1 hypothetical protein A9G34_07540 [Gilliamella apicola]OCG54912.1 hypothetical protein A9G36_06925 [Gilliamella apicola]
MIPIWSTYPLAYKIGFPIVQSVGIGKNNYKDQDDKYEREFIRCYMEHGPKSLPPLPMSFHGFGGHINPIIYASKNAPIAWITLFLGACAGNI